MEGVSPLPSLVQGCAPRPLASQPHGSRSFKDVLSGKLSASPVCSSPLQSSVHGVPALIYSEDQISKFAAPFAFTLVGKFPKSRPPLEIIRKFFCHLKLSGSFSVSLLDAHHVSIMLDNDLDYARIFSRRSFYIDKCQMGLLKWSPDLDISEESPIVPIWIALPNLRLHFINHEVLFAIGSLLGRPLQLDQATASLRRPSVARILVELDISKQLPTEVWLGSNMCGYFQKISYEKVPRFCSHCKLHGHDMAECFSLNSHMNKDKVVSKVVSNPQVTMADSNGFAHHDAAAIPTAVDLDSSRPDVNPEIQQVSSDVNPPSYSDIIPVIQQVCSDVNPPPIEIFPEIQHAISDVNSPPIDRLEMHLDVHPEIQQACSDVNPTPPESSLHGVIPPMVNRVCLREKMQIVDVGHEVSPSGELLNLGSQLGTFSFPPVDRFVGDDDLDGMDSNGSDNYLSDAISDKFIKVRNKRGKNKKSFEKSLRVTRSNKGSIF